MRSKVLIVLAVVAVLVAAGLYYFVDVEQTEEASLPDVDVQIEGGQMPEVKVETGTIETGDGEITITVPTIEVTPPEENPDSQ